MDQNQPIASPASSSSFTSSLPPVGQLFSQTWNTFSKSLLKLLLFNLLGIVIYIILGTFLGGSAILAGGASMFSALNLASLGTAAFLGILVFFAFIIVGAVLQIGSILIIDKEGNVSFGDIIKQSLALIIPFSLTTLISGALVLGGFFLLLIPGLIFSIFFAFVPYEVMIGGSRYLTALKKSYAIVKTHFWAIFLRVLLMMIVSIIFNFVVSRVLTSVFADAQMISSILTTAINTFFGVFVTCYNLTLYKQARTGLEDQEGTKITWIIVLSLIGWALGIFLGFAAAKTIPAIMNEYTNSKLQNQQNYMPDTMMDTTQPNNYSN